MTLARQLVAFAAALFTILLGGWVALGLIAASQYDPRYFYE